MSPLAYLWVWSPLLHTLCTSSPNHYHPFATHVHTIVTCFAVELTFMSTIPSLSLNSLFETLSFNLTPHIYLTIHISALWSAISFSFLKGQVLLPCNILLHTQLLYSLPLLINDISLLVSKGTNCLNLFHPSRTLASTAASASHSTLSMSPK